MPHSFFVIFVVHISLERFYGVGCEESLFFICQMSDMSTPSYFDYTFIPQSKNWSEARQYCKEKFQDLAAFKDYSDLSFAINQQDFPIWIGLHRDGEDKHDCNLSCFFILTYLVMKLIHQ